jgi:hypothetical protein
MTEFKFPLGELVKDKITDFKGTIVCQSRYLTGCLRYSVQAQELKDGKPVDWVAFDEDQLISLGSNINHETKNPAGPPRFEVDRR